MPMDMFPQTSDIWLKIHRYVPILRHQSGRIEPYRVRGCTTSGRYVRILDFRHFERFFRFDQSDRKTYKKAISDGVNVSVVLDCGFGNTSKEK